MRVIVDLHNHGRYDKNYHGRYDKTLQNAEYELGETIRSHAVPISAFADFWVKLAAELKDRPAVWAYDIMNEPHDMGNATNTAQCCAGGGQWNSVRRYAHGNNG